MGRMRTAPSWKRCVRRAQRSQPMKDAVAAIIGRTGTGGLSKSTQGGYGDMRPHTTYAPSVATTESIRFLRVRCFDWYSRFALPSRASASAGSCRLSTSVVVGSVDRVDSTYTREAYELQTHRRAAQRSPAALPAASSWPPGPWRAVCVCFAMRCERSDNQSRHTRNLRTQCISLTWLAIPLATSRCACSSSIHSPEPASPAPVGVVVGSAAAGAAPPPPPPALVLGSCSVCSIGDEAMGRPVVANELGRGQVRSIQGPACRACGQRAEQQSNPKQAKGLLLHARARKLLGYTR